MFYINRLDSFERIYAIIENKKESIRSNIRLLTNYF